LTQPQRIVLRADASLSIGTGHVVRCATLAAELINRGWRATLAARELPPALERSLPAEGIAVLRLPELPTEAEATYLGDKLGSAVDVVVADNYGIGAPWHRLAATWATLVVATDDLADRPQAVDVLLNQNLGVDEASYQGLVKPGTTVLAGPKYALLRPEFAAARARLRHRTGTVARILVFMSGADQDNTTLTAARAAASAGVAVDVVVGSAYAFEPSLRALAASFPNVSVYVNTKHMADLMESADLAIGAASSASWERCTLGLPVVLLTLADNQVEGARSLAEAGAAVNLGWFDRVSEVDVVAAVRTLVDDPGKVREMSQAAAGVTDGLGTRRVADVIERRLMSHTARAPRADGETR
jgi:UDP-2,4-diacetamido-2,4,6-trideoxy-beta-L-altropyranose hydrolase